MGSQLCLWSAVDWEVALLFVAGSSCLGLSSLEVVQGSFGWDKWAGTGTWALLLHFISESNSRGSPGARSQKMALPLDGRHRRTTLQSMWFRGG